MGKSYRFLYISEGFDPKLLCQSESVKNSITVTAKDNIFMSVPNLSFDDGMVHKLRRGDLNVVK